MCQVFCHLVVNNNNFVARNQYVTSTLHNRNIIQFIYVFQELIKHLHENIISSKHKNIWSNFTCLNFDVEDSLGFILHWNAHAQRTPSVMLLFFILFSSGKHINLLILCSFDTHQQNQAIESAPRLHHKQFIAWKCCRDVHNYSNLHIFALHHFHITVRSHHSRIQGDLFHFPVCTPYVHAWESLSTILQWIPQYIPRWLSNAPFY